LFPTVLEAAVENRYKKIKYPSDETPFNRKFQKKLTYKYNCK
jgi:hypothetical protein